MYREEDMRFALWNFIENFEITKRTDLSKLPSAIFIIKKIAPDENSYVNYLGLKWTGRKLRTAEMCN